MKPESFRLLPRYDMSLGANDLPDVEGDASLSEFRYFSDALDQAAMVAVTDARGMIVQVNEKFCAVSTYMRQELIGRNFKTFCSDVHGKEFFSKLYFIASRGSVWRGEIANTSRHGEIYWVDTTIVPCVDNHKSVVGYIFIQFDITSKKQAQFDLERASSIDDLTGLPNRKAFTKKVESDLADKDAITVIGLMDLDNFKDINDSLGHKAGDDVLRTIAGRVDDALENGDIISRLGGDEFAILLSRCRDYEDIANRVSRILDAVRRPLRIGEHDREVTASIGLTQSPKDGVLARQLLRRSDIALYAAKDNGRDIAALFDINMEKAVNRDTQLRQKIQKGIRNKEFIVYFQPIVDLHSESHLGFEALLRWRRPDGSVESAGRFIDALRDDAIGASVGTFVLEAVVEQIEQWRKNHIPFGSVAINTTQANFRTDHFVDQLLRTIARGKIERGDIAIEITERILLGSGAHHVRKAMERLHKAGIHIIFDDFGTGFASLTHLRELPVHGIKIDRSFVKAIETNSRDMVIVKAVIALAHDLGMRVTAEGVERENQKAVLCQLGCDSIQGFLISPAIAGDAVPALLKARLNHA